MIDRRCADSAAYVLCAQAVHSPSIRRPIAVMIIRDGFYDHLRQVIGVTRCQNAPTRVAYSLASGRVSCIATALLSPRLSDSRILRFFTLSVYNKLSPRGGGETICRPPMAVRSKNRGGSTSVRGRVHSPHISGSRRWLSYRQPACL